MNGPSPTRPLEQPSVAPEAAESLPARPPDPPAVASPINPETLTALRELQLESGAEVFAELLGIFVTDGTALVNQIRAAAAQNDFLALKNSAHALKGSSASMGALQLSALCAALDALEPDTALNLGEQARDIEAEFERAKQFLQTELASPQS